MAVADEQALGVVSGVQVLLLQAYTIEERVPRMLSHKVVQRR